MGDSDFDCLYAFAYETDVSAARGGFFIRLGFQGESGLFTALNTLIERGPFEVVYGVEFDV